MIKESLALGTEDRFLGDLIWMKMRDEGIAYYYAFISIMDQEKVPAAKQGILHKALLDYTDDKSKQLGVQIWWEMKDGDLEFLPAFQSIMDWKSFSQAGRDLLLITIRKHVVVEAIAERLRLRREKINQTRNERREKGLAVSKQSRAENNIFFRTVCQEVFDAFSLLPEERTRELQVFIGQELGPRGAKRSAKLRRQAIAELATREKAEPEKTKPPEKEIARPAISTKAPHTQINIFGVGVPPKKRRRSA